ncbi:hypothetical protein BG842_06960 [Haladaptatus sp. W1]|nr:hypothetical protein BG842_06960 [Haladaptatus sp. W1]
MLEACKVISIHRIPPELEDSESDKSYCCDLDTGWNSITMGSVRWFVKVVCREVSSRMVVVAIVEVVSFGVMIAVVVFVRPRDIKPAAICGNTVCDVEMKRLWIQSVIKL